MSTTATVSFFLPGDAGLDRLRGLDPDVEPVEFQTAERAWTLQTYLRLHRAGVPVELTSVLPQRGVVVFHAKHKHEVQHERRHSRHAILVALRGDRKPVLTADFEILQNGCQSDGVRTFDVPHWPQPGLVARDPTRGDRLRVAAYKGFAANLDPSFQDGRWQSLLSDLEVEWLCDAAPFDRDGFRHYPVDWSSYRDIDAVVAVRPPDRDSHLSKPASKLVNAWIAGVPALLGPEPACQALRRGPLDYFEVSSLAEAGEALRRLCNEPGLMRAVIDNGRSRAAEYQNDRLVEVWRRLLFETLPRAAASRFPARRPSLVTLTAASWLRRIGARISAGAILTAFQ